MYTFFFIFFKKNVELVNYIHFGFGIVRFY